MKYSPSEDNTNPLYWGQLKRGRRSNYLVRRPLYDSNIIL